MEEDGILIERLRYIKKARMELVNNTQSFKKAKQVINQDYNENPDELLSFKMGFDSSNYPED
jgi:hypothetical protein